MTQCTYPGGRIVSTIYDALDRKQRVADGPDAMASPLIAFYRYIGPGRVEQRDYGNGTRCDYTYDGFSATPAGMPSNPAGDFAVKHIVATHHAKISDGSVIDSRTYRWDRMGNKTQRKDVRLGGPRYTHDYSYDNIYRLIHTIVTNPANMVARETDYTLDGVGNRTQVTASPDPGSEAGPYTWNVATPEPADCPMNQYTTTPFDSRLYDRRGNLVRMIPPAGPPAQRTLVYDYRNQMVAFSDPVVGVSATYRYDALGRRIEKTVTTNGTPVTTRFFLSGWQEIEEQDAAGVTQATYVYGNYIDEVLTMRRAGTNYFYHSDDLYSVMALSDAAGTSAERYEYGDYGRALEPGGLAALAAPSPSIGNPWLFTGHRFEFESSLHCFRTRYLDPAGGRYATRDVVGIWGDVVNCGNALTYVANRSTSLLDPTGRGIDEDYAACVRAAEVARRWCKARATTFCGGVAFINKGVAVACKAMYDAACDKTYDDDVEICKRMRKLRQAGVPTETAREKVAEDKWLRLGSSGNYWPDDPPGPAVWPGLCCFKWRCVGPCESICYLYITGPCRFGALDERVVGGPNHAAYHCKLVGVINERGGCAPNTPGRDKPECP
jgi:RHS repeat-associated protein